jgi:TonB-linked SusC/RagA family outer membrane protein
MDLRAICSSRPSAPGYLTKTLRIMKLTAILLLAASLHVCAKGLSQTVTLSVKDAPLQKVFNEIKKQTGFQFFFRDEWLVDGKKVNLRVSNVPLEQALALCFKDQPFKYTIVEKTIVVSRKMAPVVKEGPPVDTSQLIIRGVVMDSTGAPVERANIRLKGTSQYTTSGTDGKFEMKNVAADGVLVFSNMGYMPVEIPLKGRKFIIVALRPQAEMLNEFTIISNGYQRLKKYQMTGAASILTEKQYDQRVAATGNFLESLEGKIPGLVYNGQSGELSIRGIATFTSVKQPLMIVDGFATEVNLLTINPNDIVSVNVLKDAAAAAIYGVRASNGVIVIETRRGKSGKAVFNFRATTAFQAKPDFSYLKYAPASEFAQLEADLITAANQGALLYGNSTTLGYPLSAVQDIMVKKHLGAITADQAAGKIDSVGSYDNLNEYENLFYQNRLTNNINFDVSGGGERSTYMLGFNYVGDKLVARRSENQQYLVNLANTYQLNSRMKFDFKGTYMNSTNVSGNIPAYTTFYPYEHLADDAGNALPVSSGTTGSGRSSGNNSVSTAVNTSNMALGLYDKQYYPYRELYSNTNTIKTSSIRFQGRLNTKITDWLNLDIGGNYENQSMRLDNLSKEDAYNTRLLLNLSALKNSTTGKAAFTNIPQGDILKRTAQQIRNYTVRGQLNLNKSFGNGDHTISGIFGIEQRGTVADLFTNTFFGYDGQTLVTKPTNLVALNNLGSTNSSFPSVGITSPYTTAASLFASYFTQTYRDTRFMSYYGDGSYNYKNKYFATGSLRLDQSNLFGSDPQYRNKPLWSAGLAWRMVEEPFMKNYHWLNDLKLRAATGFTGNIPSGNNGKYLLLTAGVTTIYPTAQTYYSVSNPENQSLRWETTKNYNLGFDYALLNNRVYGSIDYYVKKSFDIFGAYGSDPTTGFNSYNANTASIQNKGLEVIVTSSNIKKRHFQWNTTVTASINNNKITTVKSSAYTNSTAFLSNLTGAQYVVDKPINALFSYNYGGLTSLGQPYVLDSKGDQKILNIPSVDVAQTDLVYSGTTTPKYVFGLNNQFSVGAFDLSFLFMYYGGHVMRMEAPIANSLMNNNPLAGSSDYWKKAGDESTTLIPALPKGSTTAAGYYSAYAPYGYYNAAQFVRKADYIRLRDVVVTWNIKAGVLKKAGLQQPLLRLQAQNAYRYTFSGNDIDPEAINRGTGRRTLPQQPMYSLSFYSKF